MPENLPQKAFCAAPGVAHSHKNFDGLLGLLVRSWFASKTATVAGALAIIVPVVILVPCFGVIPFIVVIVAMLQEAKDWYYHERLLCVDADDNCVVGSVLHKPSVSFDGDRKLDLLLAPYTEPECYEAMCTHVNANAGLLNQSAVFDDPPFFDGTVPAPPPTCDPDVLTDPTKSAADRLAERQAISDYLDAIKGEDPEDGDATADMYNNLLVGYMDRLLDPSNTNSAGEPKNFQGRYYRKDPAVIPPASALSGAIPPDFDPDVAWQALDGSRSDKTRHNPYEVQHQPRGINPMFRFDRKRLLPFLHCELDGYSIALLLDQLSLALTSFGIAYTFFCMVLGPLLGAVIGALFAALIFLLQWLLDGGSDGGHADAPDVDFDDPGNFGEGGQQLDGDLVALYGPWIMDTEHAQYFEIHPVKAYYIMGRDGMSGALDPFDTAEELGKSGAERLHNGSIDDRSRLEICRLVNEAEDGDIPPVIERTGPAILSHGLVTRWGGGKRID